MSRTKTTSTVKTATTTATTTKRTYKPRAKKEPKNPLSLNTQHDYITLRTPNGNFTTSWSKSKATGNLAKDTKSFVAIDEYVKDFDGTVSDAMQSLTDPSVLSKLWPDWNKEVIENMIAVGDKVKFRARSPFIKKYSSDFYPVVKVARKYVYLKISKEVVGFDYTELEK